MVRVVENEGALGGGGSGTTQPVHGTYKSLKATYRTVVEAIIQFMMYIP